MLIECVLHGGKGRVYAPTGKCPFCAEKKTDITLAQLKEASNRALNGFDITSSIYFRELAKNLNITYGD